MRRSVWLVVWLAAWLVVELVLPGLWTVPAWAQVLNLCPETITYRQRIGVVGVSTSPGTGAGGALTAGDLDANFAALAHICGANIRAEDWGTALAAGCVLEAQADGTIGCGAAPAGLVDEIADVDPSLRTGTAGQLVTGAAGVAGRCAEWSGTGDLVAAGAACGSGGGGGSDPWGGSYHPDRETGVEVSESFDGISPDLTWRVFNDGDTSLTMTLAGDGTALLEEPSPTTGDKMMGWWTDPPTGTGAFAVWAKLAWGQTSSFTQGGLAVLVGGSEAAPTQIHMARVVYLSLVSRHSATSYTSFGTPSGSVALPSGAVVWMRPLYLFMAWDGTNLVTATSIDGWDWVELGSPMATPRPTSIGLWLIDASNSAPRMRVWYFRASTSADALARRIGG